MAPAPQQSSPSNFFDVYDDNAPNRNLSSMPRGGCNFVDLTPGTAGSCCGCKRFWGLHCGDNTASAQLGWCMCNHHACYHDERSTDETSAHTLLLPTAPVAGQENEKPKTGRDPLSPVFDLSLGMPCAMNDFEIANFAAPPSLSFLNNFAGDIEMMNAPSILQPPPAPSLPDTLNRGDFIHTDGQHSALAPVPPQCLLSHKTASTTTSSTKARYSRPFAGKGLHTLAGAHDPTAQSPLRQTSKSRSQVTHDPPVGQLYQPSGTPMTGLSTLEEPRALERAMSLKGELDNLTKSPTLHHQRLEKLETASFAAAATAAHDDCVDKHDHLDLRVTDLEGKVEELEKFANENNSIVPHRDELPDDDGTTTVSVSTSSATRRTNASDLTGHLQALQSRVSQLQSFLPSANQPWEVEVVFFPFPLKKIWQEINLFKLDPTLSNDDWTQLPQTNSASILRSQSPIYGDWTTPDHDAEWLLPKACGDKSVTDKRLRSRGLIKTISVKGPDARSVHMAVMSAFGGVFREMQIAPRQQDTDARCSRFIGLQSMWIPLRKIHRDSRLRFLSPAEMVTPALWDVQFLSSVMMRSSEPRLFITHSDAYLQDYLAYEAGWTWQRVRELTRVYPDIDAAQQVLEADALEEYWSWSEALDEPPNAQTSMSLRRSRRHTTISPSCARLPRSEHRYPQSPAANREHVMAGQRRSSSRADSLPPPGRPAAAPTPIARHPSIENQRRASTNSCNRRSSPALRAGVQGGIFKGRSARSPSFPLYTPRWTHSPSPMPWAGPQDRQPLRGMTPFAYATPHSNAPPPPPPPPQQEGLRTRSGSAHFEPHHAYNRQQSSSRANSAMLVDEEGDIEIYNSESDKDFEDFEDEDEDEDNDEDEDEDDNDNNDNNDYMSNVEMMTDAQPRLPLAGVSEWPCKPEDELWHGIEDQMLLQPQRGGNAENIDPDAASGSGGSDCEEEDVRRREESEESSQPSEYPSTQIMKCDSDDDFLIHED